MKCLLIMSLLKDGVMFNYVQNFEQSDHKITYCENRDEAQALVNFLWNEKGRHLNDVREIWEDIHLLLKKWGVVPSRIRRFVKP